MQNGEECMKDLVLRCIMENKTYQHTMGQERHIKYREANIVLDITQQSIVNIVCPCCGEPLEFRIYPGIRFGDTFRLAYPGGIIVCLFFLLIGILSCYISFSWHSKFFAFLGIGLLILCYFSADDFLKHQNPKIIVKGSGTHDLLSGSKSLTTISSAEESLQKRKAYY
jgi:hypothetical protein